MNNKHIGWLAAAVVGAGAIYWFGHRHDGVDAQAASAPGAAAAVLPVGLATARMRDVPVVIDEAGSVVSLNTVDVHAQVASTIRTVDIKEGQFVRKGELLFTFDDRPDRANLEKARAQLARDKATAADAERQWIRAKDLLAQNFVAQSAVDTAKANYDAQVAAVGADLAAQQAAEVALSYDTIRSPLAGRAGAVNVYPGTLVSPSGNPLVTISQIDPIGVNFTVPETQVGSLLKGLTAGEKVTILPSDAQPAGTAAARRTSAADAAIDKLPEGRLSFVDNAIDTATGTIHAKAEVPNAQAALWPGQYVTARLQLRTIAGAVVIPQASVIQRGDTRGVYVADANDTVAWREVTTRYPFGELVVVDGVKDGERVVTDGKQNVKPGSVVKENLPAAKAARPAEPSSGASQ